MKVLVVALLGLVPSLTLAALCDDTYNLQSVSQTFYTGANPKSLTKGTAKVINPNLSNLDILSQSANYKFVSKFDGSCSKGATTIVFKTKGAGKSAFTDTTDKSYQIELFDSSTQVDKFKYDFWFGFYHPADALVAYLGRTNANATAFVNAYSLVTYVDSVQDDSTLIWHVSSGYVGPSGPADSASLYDRLLAATGLMNTTFTNKHKAYFTVQMLTFSYENKPAPVSVVSAKKTMTGFQANQTGNLVLIRAGEKGVNTSEPLSLYGMMGNKVAALHPTGYLYQWNGKTSAGADAPTGVYFVQAGNRILGKFFYSR